MANENTGTNLSQILAPPLPTSQPPRDIRRDVQHGKFYTYLHQYTGATILAAGAFQQVQQFVVDGQTLGFAVQRIAVLADNLGFKLQLESSASGEKFFQDPIFGTNLGSGQFPLVIVPPWLIRKNNILTARASDAQAVAAVNNVFIAYFGSKLYLDPVVRARRYTAAKEFIYTANFTTYGATGIIDSGLGSLAANATRVYNGSVDADSDFEVQKITVVSDAPVTVQIVTDADQWFDSDIRSELLGGSLIENPVAPEPSGWHPFILPAPRLISAAGYFRVRVSNTVAAVNRCEVQLHGTRLYPPGGVGGESMMGGARRG